MENERYLTHKAAILWHKILQRRCYGGWRLFVAWKIKGGFALHTPPHMPHVAPGVAAASHPVRSCQSIG
jgi:hypothetical protein